MKRLLVVATIAALFLCSAFADDSNKQNQNQNRVIGPHDEATESQLARQIRHAILMLPYYSVFSEIAFRIDGSVVTLMGACPPDPPWDIKSDAENVVKRIPGVTKVNNEIKLLPLSPMDWQIRRAVFRAIYGDPQIGTRYGYQALPSIHIIVDNGHVTLTGVVDNQFDDTLIRTRANSVPNVFSVTDNLIVLNKQRK